MIVLWIMLGSTVAGFCVVSTVLNMWNVIELKHKVKLLEVLLGYHKEGKPCIKNPLIDDKIGELDENGM